jgi:hypothetical protein
MFIDKHGVWFRYETDNLCRRWPWKIFSPDMVYISERHDRSFATIADYLKFVGVAESGFGTKKVEGFTYNQIIQEWVRTKYRSGFVIVLYDIDVSYKPSEFWKKVPKENVEQLNKDVVIFRCKDASQVISICESINVEFAQVIGFKDGYIFYYNIGD